MTKREPIAITGISALFPGSTDMAGFWNDILAGRDLLTDVPSHYWLVEDFYDPNPAAVDKTYGRRGGFLTRGTLRHARIWHVPSCPAGNR